MYMQYRFFCCFLIFIVLSVASFKFICSSPCALLWRELFSQRPVDPASFYFKQTTNVANDGSSSTAIDRIRAGWCSYMCYVFYPSARGVWGESYPRSLFYIAWSVQERQNSDVLPVCIPCLSHAEDMPSFLVSMPRFFLVLTQSCDMIW